MHTNALVSVGCLKIYGSLLPSVAVNKERKTEGKRSQLCCTFYRLRSPFARFDFSGVLLTDPKPSGVFGENGCVGAGERRRRKPYSPRNNTWMAVDQGNPAHEYTLRWKMEKCNKTDRTEHSWGSWE